MSPSENLIAQRIQAYRNNPIYPLELELLQKQLKSPKTSLVHFKHHYQRDPIFCAELVSLAWEATKNRGGHPFAADHAMSIIGMGAASSHFRHFKPRKAPEISDEVKFLLTSSLLAAELAGEISEKPACYWGAMFHQLPEIILWHISSRPMWHIHYREVSLPKKLKLFEEVKLGFNLHRWRQAVAENFHMGELNCITYAKDLPNKPTELIDYMKHGLTDKNQRLKDWHRTDSWLIVVSNWLAKSMLHPAMRNSYHHYRLLMEKSFNLCNRKMSKIIGESLGKTSENLIGSALLNPAACFLFQKSKPVYPQWLISPEIDPNRSPKLKRQHKSSVSGQSKSGQSKLPDRAPVTQKPEVTKRKSQKITATETDGLPPTSQSKVTPLIKRLEKTPESFESGIQMISQVLQSIVEKLQYDRVSLMSIERKGEFATTKIALSQNGLKKLRLDFSFKKDPVSPASPLRKFTEQQGGLLFEKSKHGSIWPRLPQVIHKEKIERFFLFSVKPANQVKILIYVDAENESLFSPAKLSLLKKLLNALNSALIVREKNKVK